MREIDWQRRRPDARAVDALWRELDIRPVPWDRPGVAALLGELRGRYTNGGVLFACLELGPHPVLDWFAARNRLSEVDFERRLLASAAVRAAMPELGGPLSAVSATFHRPSSVLLPGHFADALWFGGACSTRPDVADEQNAEVQRHLRVATAACADLVEQRWADVLAATTSEPWAPWFAGIAWDTTWVLLDRAHRRVFVLCGTDTD